MQSRFFNLPILKPPIEQKSFHVRDIEFTAELTSYSGADLQGGLGGLSPPTSLRPMDTPLIPPLIFEMKQWRRREEEEEEKGRKKKNMDMSPIYIFELDSPQLPSVP